MRAEGRGEAPWSKCSLGAAVKGDRARQVRLVRVRPRPEETEIIRPARCWRARGPGGRGGSRPGDRCSLRRLEAPCPPPPRRSPYEWCLRTRLWTSFTFKGTSRKSSEVPVATPWEAGRRLHGCCWLLKLFGYCLCFWVRPFELG